jgi:hypothetical protein
VPARPLLIAALILLASCGEGANVSDGVVPPSNDRDIHSMGACVVNLDCDNGLKLSCSSAAGNCSSTTSSVTCDGVTTHCNGSGSSCAPKMTGIVQTIPACYPAHWPYGRYLVAGRESGVTYTWSAYSANLISTYTDPSNWVAATGVGWFTLTVTASRPGCPVTTTVSQDFWAYDYETDAGICY